jgi:hypothetical protein
LLSLYHDFLPLGLFLSELIMVYAADQYQASVIEMARQGNLQAIAYWLNALLAPYRLFARVDTGRSGHLRVVVELRPGVVANPTDSAFRNRLVRYICHQLWKLNSPQLDGALIVARYVGQQELLWKQSVRIVAPARRELLAHSPQSLQSRLRSVSRQRKQFQTLRSILISGTSVAAFVLGCWLGYADAPSDQTQAAAVLSKMQRGNTKVETSLGAVAILAPKEVSNTPEVNLMFGGDVSFGEPYDTNVGVNQQWSLGNMAEARAADISMVNLDTPLTQATQVLPGKKSNVKASPDRVNVLLTGGVDLVNLANSRSMDYQTAGLRETLDTLGKAGIATVGAGTDAAAARKPVIMEVKGQRIAYLSYYDSDLHAATDRTAGTNPRRNDRIAADIKAIRDQVGWVVVNYHWGEELAKYPGDWQIDLARFTIDQGADMVVGHHAKVLQGAEIYKGRPIAYSLGNFVFGGQSSDKAASDYDTAVLKVGLKDQKMRVEFLPVEVRNFQARVVKGDRATQILEQINNVSDIFEEPLHSPMIVDVRSNAVVPAPSDPVVPVTPPGEVAPAAVTSPAVTPTGAPTVTPTGTPSESVPPADAAHPWNQNGFTEPEQQQQGNAVTGDLAPKPTIEDESPLTEPVIPTGGIPKDALESPRRRFAQGIRLPIAAIPDMPNAAVTNAAMAK